jgi:hypothetical protein
MSNNGQNSAPESGIVVPESIAVAMESINTLSVWLKEVGLDESAIAVWKFNALAKNFPDLGDIIEDAKKLIITSNTQGYLWKGGVNVTDSVFRIITRPGAVRRGKEYGFFRRQLHFEVPDKSGTRKRKGGTITPFGFRVGDLVKASKSKEIFVGYIGGFTNTDKSKNVSIYDYTWKRIGQFTPSKVQLLRRSNGLCVA